MFFKRLIGAIIVKNGIAVQSHLFSRFLPVGAPEIVAENFCRWGVDEILLLDIDASREGRTIDPQIVASVADKINVPLSVGGGICTIDQALKMLHIGADKISFNTALLKCPEIIREMSWQSGAQSVIASIDCHRTDEGVYRAFSKMVPDAHNRSVTDIAKRAQDLGAGEILLNATHRDGQKTGFDLELLATVREAVELPIIAMGGAGTPAHFVEAYKIPGIATAAANVLNHFEHSITLIKKAIGADIEAIRHSKTIPYQGFDLELSARPKKLPFTDLRRRLMTPIIDLNTTSL